MISISKNFVVFEDGDELIGVDAFIYGREPMVCVVNKFTSAPVIYQCAKITILV